MCCQLLPASVPPAKLLPASVPPATTKIEPTPPITHCEFLGGKQNVLFLFGYH